GGSFLVYRDGASGKITTYDGREEAPASTKPDQFLGADGKPSFTKWIGGDSVGVAGTMPVLAMAQKDHGKLALARPLDPETDLAEGGFKIDEHLNGFAARTPGLKDSPGVGSYLFAPDGNPLPVGTEIRNVDYAHTMHALADNPRALNEGPI